MSIPHNTGDETISTHTLTWSVTDKRQANRQTTDISTHTLTWSVTNMWHLYDGYWNFNSHAHVERDPITSRLYWFARSISTHTLTWSVTYKMTPRDGVEVNFNSHAHVERDRRTDNPGRTDFYFNSHAHVERD